MTTHTEELARLRQQLDIVKHQRFGLCTQGGRAFTEAYMRQGVVVGQQDGLAGLQLLGLRHGTSMHELCQLCQPVCCCTLARSGPELARVEPDTRHHRLTTWSR